MGQIISLPSHGEQNRLIIENMDLVERVAAEFRGAKGIPFEDLCAEGRVGLVLAARRGKFRKFDEYAEQAIRNTITEFVSKWREFEPLETGDEFERHFYEWTIWASAVPAEKWGKLPATPEQLLVAFEECHSDISALNDSFNFLSNRERSMLRARFFRDPRQEMDAIARDWKISRWRATFIIKRALEKLRTAMDNRRRKQA